MLLTMVGSIGQLFAQTSGGFNPSNPPDPQVPVFKEYRPVTVAVTPQDAGFVSRSGSSSKNGMFEVGTRVTVSRSTNANFTFKHWLRNGEVYTPAGTSSSFTYTVEDAVTEFTAVYEFSPSNPADPNGTVSSRLTLQCEPSGACSFTLTSGSSHEVGSNVRLGVNPNQDYEFIGWYDGTTLVSTDASTTYVMPYHDTTLTARFRYTWVFSPDNPDDPTSQGGNIQTEENKPDYKLGDVNGDGEINVTDIVYTADYILGNSDPDFNELAADMNEDGEINVTDIVYIADKILTGGEKGTNAKSMAKTHVAGNPTNDISIIRTNDLSITKIMK